MKSDRLKTLYERPLVYNQSHAREFPADKNLSRPLKFYPQKPDNCSFDILEIGPGRGDFMIHMAMQHPEKRIVAVEYGDARFARFEERLPKLNLKNLTVIGGDARIPVLQNFFEPTLERIYVLFPDPWPRNRHRHLRLLTKDFCRKLCDLLKPGGSFTLATDVEDYARFVLSHFVEFNDMKNLQGQDLQKSPMPDLIPTFFEQKWKSIGRVSNYVRFKKT